MAPFFVHKVWVLHHSHHCLLRISRWIKNVIKLCQRSAPARLDNGGDNDKEMNQGAQGDNL